MFSNNDDFMENIVPYLSETMRITGTKQPCKRRTNKHKIWIYTTSSCCGRLVSARKHYYGGLFLLPVDVGVRQNSLRIVWCPFLCCRLHNTTVAEQGPEVRHELTPLCDLLGVCSRIIRRCSVQDHLGPEICHHLQAQRDV